MPIQFYLKKQKTVELVAPKVVDWIIYISDSYNYPIESINYIFCTDTYLLAINKEFLNHDYYTDVLTFDHSEGKSQLEADIYISYERVKDNANQLGVSYSEEICRVILHGLLHLLGHLDNTTEKKREMRKVEDKYLSILPNYVPRGTFPFLDQLCST